MCVASGPAPPPLPQAHSQGKSLGANLASLAVTVRRILVAVCDVLSGDENSTIALHSSTRVMTCYVTRRGGGKGLI